MKRLIILLIVLSVVAVGSAKTSKPANETPLPKAPTGFNWERFAEVKSAFLCPEGWHRFHKKGKSSHSYALSKEPVEKQGSFETGMTLQVIKDIMEKKQIPASVFSIEMAVHTLDKKENTEISSGDISKGPFKAFRVRYRNAPSVAKSIIIHQLFIANDKQDTLFIITFEAPETEWDEAWELGDVMLKNLMIDDEY